ncbi:MAG: LytTR family DNA-binding domain-containing protein [Bacteroidota bacterium]
MKVLLVEDEKHARDNLEHLLLEIEPTIEILAKLESVKRTVEWLGQNQADLIFLDIHLADDLSFKIFEKIKVTTPVIFTTAYDKYALKAFKVNSIDYLLKPIDEEELAASIEKYKATQLPNQVDYAQLQNLMNAPKKSYQQRFLVTRRDKIRSLTVDQIAYFEGEDRYVYLINKEGNRFIVDYKLSDLEDLLDPKIFFRLNRSFIAHFDAIDSITGVSKSRLKVDLKPKARRDIIVSSANTKHFKAWLNK